MREGRQRLLAERVPAVQLGTVVPTSSSAFGQPVLPRSTRTISARFISHRDLAKVSDPLGPPDVVSSSAPAASDPPHQSVRCRLLRPDACKDPRRRTAVAATPRRIPVKAPLLAVFLPLLFKCSEVLLILPNFMETQLVGGTETLPKATRGRGRNGIELLW